MVLSSEQNKNFRSNIFHGETEIRYLRGYV